MYQTHISENVDEVRIVEDTYGMHYAKVYDESGILTDKVSMYRVSLASTILTG